MVVVVDEGLVVETEPEGREEALRTHEKPPDERRHEEAEETVPRRASSGTHDS